MRNSSIILFLLAAFSSAAAQEPVIKRYATGELASRETFLRWPGGTDTQFKDEKVEVFNRKGDVVFEGSRRNYAGHSSVHLSYHPNGGVSRIEASSAPDAGIQWYRSHIVLDEDGNVTDRKEYSHDMTVTLPKIDRLPPPSTVQAVNACATPMESSLVIHNRSASTITVRLLGRFGGETGKEYVDKLEPGDSLVTPPVVNAERFLAPEAMFEVYLIDPKTRRSERMDFARIPMRQIEPRRQHRIYEFYWVDGLQ